MELAVGGTSIRLAADRRCETLVITVERRWTRGADTAMRSWFTLRKEHERNLDDEIQFHLDEEVRLRVEAVSRRRKQGWLRDARSATSPSCAE